MTSSLLQRLGIALPIIQGPMTGSDTPALAAAVSSAGGLGMLGCGMRSPAAMAEAAAEVRRRTDRPFGMNLFVQATPTPDDATVLVRRRGYQSPALDALLAALQGTQQPSSAWISSP